VTPAAPKVCRSRCGALIGPAKRLNNRWALQGRLVRLFAAIGRRWEYCAHQGGEHLSWWGSNPAYHRGHDRQISADASCRAGGEQAGGKEGKNSFTPAYRRLHYDLLASAPDCERQHCEVERVIAAISQIRQPGNRLAARKSCRDFTCGRGHDSRRAARRRVALGHMPGAVNRPFARD